MSAYFRELTFELRQRRYTEAEVSSIVSRAEKLVSDDGRSAELALGPVLDYASAFPERVKTTPDMRHLNIAYIVVAIAGLGYLALRLLVPAIDMGARVGIYGLMAALISVTVVGFATSWRRHGDEPDH